MSSFAKECLRSYVSGEMLTRAARQRYTTFFSDFPQLGRFRPLPKALFEGNKTATGRKKIWHRYTTRIMKKKLVSAGYTFIKGRQSTSTTKYQLFEVEMLQALASTQSFQVEIRQQRRFRRG